MIRIIALIAWAPIAPSALAQGAPVVNEVISREVSALFTPGSAEFQDGTPVIDEAVSREISTLLSDGPGESEDGSPVILEAASREVSTLLASGPAESEDGSPVILEIISRELSTLLEDGPPDPADGFPVILETPSREISVLLESGPLVPFAEVISRELTALSTLAPVVRLEDGNGRYFENQTPQPVSSGATVLDAESDFAGGTLTARIVARAEASDRIRLAARDGVRVDSTDVLVNDVRVGTVNVPNAVVAGDGALAVTLLAAADNGSVQALVRALSFDSVSEDPTPDARTVSIEVTDAAARSVGAKQRALDVFPVNDPPTVVIGVGPVVSEDSGPQAIPGWAGGFSPGPIEESEQTLVTRVDHDQASLFSAGPVLGLDGVLRFTPAENAHGVANATVVVTDSGGTAHGGLNTVVSPPFTITVSSVNDLPVATSDTLERRRGVSAKIRLQDLLSNDSDIEPGELAVAVVDPVSANGMSLGVVEGWVRYPATEETADDWFGYTVRDSEGGSSTGRVNVRVAVDDARTLNVVSIRMEGGDVHLVFQGIPDSAYSIQYTTSLTNPNWTTLGTRTAGNTGRFEWTDSSPPDPVRYYRTARP